MNTCQCENEILPVWKWSRIEKPLIYRKEQIYRTTEKGRVDWDHQWYKETI